MRFATKVATECRRTAAITFVIVSILASLNSNGFSQSAARLEIKTLSSRPDLVSGGDALVEVKAPAGAQLKDLTLTLNGNDVTSRLRLNADGGSFRGLISGMVVGDNTLTAKLKSPRAAQASLKITNDPITGPILSGQHLTPYECRTVESGLGEPLDADCTAKQKIEYFYRASNNAFKPLANPAGPRPTDLVNTTTNDGKTAPYIVRVDSGTINRSIYRIAILDDPNPETSSVNGDQGEWAPGAGWNHKLAVSFGGGAGTQYNQGVNQATAALSHPYLSRGFAFMVSTELVNQQHGNAVLQGEALMMLKEYFIERYGPPKWTVGVGGSGGAIQQLV